YGRELPLFGAAPVGQRLALPRDVAGGVLEIHAEEVERRLRHIVVALQRFVNAAQVFLAEQVAGQEAGDAVQPAPLPPARQRVQCGLGVVAARERLPVDNLPPGQTET